MSLNKIQIALLHLGLSVTFLSILSGCSALKEGLTSQIEVPTLEKQVNRVAIGMDIVRENHVMEMKMKISSDASWPEQIATDLSQTQERVLTHILRQDPYYATIYYSEPFQRRMLGGSILVNELNKMAQANVGTLFEVVADPISPLAYSVAQKAQILYGDDPREWPDLFSFEGGLENFLEFKNGNLKMVEAVDSDVYDSLSDALIALTPTNFQKDLSLAKSDLNKAQEKVANLEGEKSSLQTQLNQNQTRQYGATSLSNRDKIDIQTKISEIDMQLPQANQDADEKEKIYFSMLDSSVTAMQSDMKLSREQIKLARNVNLASKVIKNGANEAYSSFGIALTNLSSEPILRNFPRELLSLAKAAAVFPRYADQFRIRIERLTKNAIYFLPNISMGTYYAHKQSSLASKYEDISALIIDAANAKVKADKAVNEETKEQM